jgi:hypothetical protein
MPFFQRYCLSKEFFQFDEISPDLVHPLAWFGTWGLILGCLAFYLYWIFVWAASSSGQGSERGSNGNLEAWAWNFLIGFTQDLMFVQVARVYLVHVACLKAMRPQLNAINTSLNNIALRLVDSNEDGLDLDADLYKSSGLDLSLDQALDKRLDQISGQSSDRNHAFSVRYGSREEIQSLRVVQHLSGTCRVARKALVANLFAARVLRSVNDQDLALCQGQDLGLGQRLDPSQVQSHPISVEELNQVSAQASTQGWIRDQIHNVNSSRGRGQVLRLGLYSLAEPRRVGEMVFLLLFFVTLLALIGGEATSRFFIDTIF